MERGRQALTLLLSILSLAFTATSQARELPLNSLTCTGGADSASAALELAPAALDCSAARFDQRARFVRTHTDLGPAFLPPGERLLWQTDPSSFDSMVLRFVFADGTVRLVDVDAQMAARNWFARTRFSVPVPNVGAPLAAIDAVIERPQTTATARDVRLIDEDSAAAEHLGRVIVYALICGILLVPIIYDLLFYRVLRARFMLWHIAMTCGLLLFALSNTGLAFALVPDLPLDLRFQLNTASLALAVACAVGFVIGILEDGTYPRRLGRLTIGLAILVVAVKLLSLFEIEALRIIVHEAFLLSLLPLALAIMATIACALAERSRVAVFLAIAFMGMVFAGSVRLLSAAGWVDAAAASDDVLFAALVVLVIGTSAAVGDRFLILRAQRDRARRHALELARLAHSDGLTGLSNRRAFDRIGRMAPNRGLLIADIDRFKSINDREGHAVGDAVLRHAAQVLRDTFGSTSDARIFRLGGEEFAVTVGCLGEEGLRLCGERLRRAIEAQGSVEDEDLPQITVSVGGAMSRGRPIEEVFLDADAALFRAKNAGRNRCRILGLESADSPDTAPEEAADGDGSG